MYRLTALAFAIACIAGVNVWNGDAGAYLEFWLITLVIALVGGVMFLLIGLMDDDQ